MPKTFVYGYKPGSQSARALASSLAAPLIRHTGSTFRGSQAKTVINWGSSKLPEQVLNCNVLNKQAVVKCAGNKLRFFEHQTIGTSPGTPTSVTSDLFPRLVMWTSNKDNALRWLTEGCTIVTRTVLTGHSGSGIIIVEPGSELPDAPLYTKYVKKDSEWRVHVMKTGSNSEGSVIDIQRKIRNPDQEPTNWQVRSHANGFIFVRNEINPPPDVVEQALRAFNRSGLDFGAVDVIFNRHQDRAYVLEINTAPGLQGQTVESYVNGFKKLLGEAVNV